MKLRAMAIAMAMAILLAGCTNPHPDQSASSEPPSTEANAQGTNENTQPAPESKAEFESLVSTLDEMASKGLFSGTVLVARDDDILLEKAYGFAGDNVPMQTDTKLNLGSIGKSFTAVAIVQLVQAGKLSYDDIVEAYVPALAALSKGEMTVRHLLNHTSGLGNFFVAPGYMENKDHITKINEMLPYITHEPLQFRPGERFSYSNSGYIALGLIIEAVSGQDYNHYVEEHVFKPAGMTATGNYAKTDNISNLAVGWMGENREDNTQDLPSMGSPAGGGYATAGDMLRFVNALKDGTLLSGAFDELIGNAISPVSSDYGFGMIRFPVSGDLVAGHNGGAPGVSSHYETYLNSGYTVVVLSNFDDAIFEVVDAIRREIAGPGAGPTMQAPDMSNAVMGSVVIDGAPIAVRVEPVEIDGVVYAPVDDIAKELGGRTRRDPGGGTIEINGMQITLNFGSETIAVDGNEKGLPAPVVSMEPCLMAPISFFEIVFAYEVSMDDGVLTISTAP